MGCKRYFYVEMYNSEGIRIYRAFGTLEDNVFAYDEKYHFSKRFGAVFEDELKKLDLDNWMVGEKKEINKREGSQIYKKEIVYLGNDLEKIMNNHPEIDDLIEEYIKYHIEND